MTLDHAPIVDAFDGDCDQPLLDDAIVSARRLYARANMLRYDPRLPLREVERLDAVADAAARTLRRLGVTP